jgi:hypothetical protein
VNKSSGNGIAFLSKKFPGLSSLKSGVGDSMAIALIPTAANSLALVLPSAAKQNSSSSPLA